jgi:hypothetical protein
MQSNGFIFSYYSTLQRDSGRERERERDRGRAREKRKLKISIF